LVIYSHSANFLLKLTVGTQNRRLNVKPHEQILYVNATNACNR